MLINWIFAIPKMFFLAKADEYLSDACFCLTAYSKYPNDESLGYTVGKLYLSFALVFYALADALPPAT